MKLDLTTIGRQVENAFAFGRKQPLQQVKENDENTTRRFADLSIADWT